MAVREQPLGTRAGDWIIDFEHKGDVFPVHDHGPGGGHVTIVVSGGIKILGSNTLTQESVFPPSVIDWGDGSHGFVALADNTRIVNVGKRSRSRGVDDGEREAHQRGRSD
jgi:hypothetical protein